MGWTKRLIISCLILNLAGLSEAGDEVYIKKHKCMFAQVNPNFYTSCKNDAEICSGSGGEADPCEGDTPDPETDYFCTADIPDGQDQKKPWVKCSNECFNPTTSEPREYNTTTSCSTEASMCQFPFKVKNSSGDVKEYTDCTDDIIPCNDGNDECPNEEFAIVTVGGIKKQKFKWCATSVNDNRIMKKKKWGICDIKPEPIPTPPHVSKMRCNVKQERCEFDNSSCNQYDSEYFCEFTPEGYEPEPNLADQAEYSDDVSGKPTGLCSDSCFNETGYPKVFQGGDNMDIIQLTLSGCKTRPSECKFPFKYEGETYHHCTDTLIDGSTSIERESFLWCATQTDTNGNMVDGRWGVCDLETCKLEDESSPTISAVANIFPEKKGGINATIVFKQQKGGILKITGTITGLTQGSHGFHVHEIPDTSDQCRAAGPHFNPTGSKHGKMCGKESHAGDLGNIEANKEGKAEIKIYINPGCQTTLFGENTIIGRTLVIHKGEDDLGQGNSDASQSTGNAGSRLACAVIEDSSEGKALQWYIYLLIALAILFLIIIAYLLFQYFKKGRCGKYDPAKTKEKSENGNGVIAKEGPLFDELSIPFIDASPTNTPRMGRSVERLGSFFKGSIGRSRGSLSNEEATA